jgi:hypothetical protein
MALKQHSLRRQNAAQPYTGTMLRILRLIPRRKDQHWPHGKSFMHDVGKLADIINVHARPRMNQSGCTTLDPNHDRDTLT